VRDQQSDLRVRARPGAALIRRRPLLRGLDRSPAGHHGCVSRLELGRGKDPGAADPAPGARGVRAARVAPGAARWRPQREDSTNWLPSGSLKDAARAQLAVGSFDVVAGEGAVEESADAVLVSF